MIVSQTTQQHIVQRYMIVEYASSVRNAFGFDQRGAFKNHLPVHHLLQKYHWVHLDNGHVLVTAYVPHHHLKLLDEHPSVSLMPSGASNASVRSAMKKPAHWEAFKSSHAAGLDADKAEAMTLRDVVGSFAQRYGAVFAPPY